MLKFDLLDESGDHLPLFDKSGNHLLHNDVVSALGLGETTADSESSKRQKVKLVITAPQGWFLRRGGYYEVEIIGAANFGRSDSAAAEAPRETAQPKQPSGTPEQAAPTPASLQVYKTVTPEQLKHPADDDWLMYRRTYNGWGYSPLAQITPENVDRLKPVWTKETGQVGGHQAPPIVNNGVMFVATPGNQVLAIDAKAGGLLWRFKRPIPEDMALLHPTSRGVAVLDDKVYFAAADATLVALDARNGDVVWTAPVEDYRRGYYMSLAPLVAHGMVMVGVSSGMLGVRGFVHAFDADTGKNVWRTYTIPGPGEPGHETWPSGEQWQTGGGSVWITGVYDTETNITFWGTGNAEPWTGDRRPGDSLFTSSVLALDAGTGMIKGFHHYHPNNSWDWDEASPPIIVDYQRGGRTVKGLVDTARDGYLWWLERTADRINFVDGKPFVRQNVFKRLDPETGRPNVDPSREPAPGKNVDFCPSLWGGKDWPPVAYSPKNRLLYVPANDNLCGSSVGEAVSYMPRRYLGATTTLYIYPGADHIGELQAWNLDTGQKVWAHPFAKSQLWGPVLATGGGVVFMGGTNDGYFRAFDANNGKVLWEFRTGSGVNGVPVSFAVDGKQYIAVQSGWGADAARMQTQLNLARPGEYPDVPQGGSVWVFAVD